MGDGGMGLLFIGRFYIDGQASYEGGGNDKARIKQGGRHVMKEEEGIKE